MRLRRHTRVLTSWLAILAILMAAIAPSISHAMALKKAAPWVEICSSDGARWVQAHAGSNGDVPSPLDAHKFEHCPYCSFHAGGVALPAAPATGVPALLSGHDLPIAFRAAPVTLHAWVSAQPRAPPLFS